MKSVLTVIFCALLLVGGQPLRGQTPPAGFTSTVVSSGWNEAVGFAFNSTGSKMFVWERPGKVWVVVNGQRQQILDISPEVGAWADHGLLGFALDPNFDTNGYLYLLYVVDRHYLLNFGTGNYSATANDYFSATIGRITRYTATASGTGYTVSPASRKILLGATKSTGIPSVHDGHCTGSLVFGTDGTLLVSTGDGAHWAPDLGSYNETYYAEALADGIISAKENVGALRAQLVDCLSGKILRLDPATGNGVPSNPFYDAASPAAARSRVWALGLRTPFRMSLRPGTGNPDPSAGNPGTLYVGVVGASTWEEVSVVDRPRVNLGWPIFEGLTPYPAFTTSNVYNRDAPNPLFNTGGCTKQFFYFQDLIKPATPAGTATFPNSCNTAQTIPASIPTFVHTRPLIDWAHSSSGPARTGTFSGSTVSLTAAPAAGFAFTGWSGDASGTANPLSVTMNGNKTITATFTATAGAQQLSGFVLVNASTGTDIQPLTAGATLNLSSLPSRSLNVRATTSPATVGSVVFALSGTQTQNQTESVAPYALFGDNGAGTYNVWTPAVGSYTLTARPYTSGGGGGTAGTPLTITFGVTDAAARVAAATTSSSGLALAEAYPNPSPNGRFRLLLPADFQGAVRYRLISALGQTLAGGTLPAGARTAELDFAQPLAGTSLSYLLLEDGKHAAQLKLLRQ